MADVQLLAVLVSAALLLVVLELVRRRLLGEEHAFVWLLGALVMLVMSTWPGALRSVAQWLGVHYGPALLVLLLAFGVFVGLLYFSVVVSRQRTQIERLIEDVAILEARLRESATRPANPASSADPSCERPPARDGTEP